MSLPAFDTLKFAKRLKEVGVPEPQAEVQVEMFAEAMAERMATKEDLTKTEATLQKEIQEIKRDIKELDAKTETRFREMDAKLKELELRMVIKMGAMILGSIGILFGLMRAWPLPVQYVPSPGQEMRYTAPVPPAPQSVPAPVVTAPPPAPMPTVTAPETHAPAPGKAGK